MNTNQLYRGKQKALKALEGGHSESYGKLPRYAVEVWATNPGSVVMMECNMEWVGVDESYLTFKRFFISFDGISSGFIQHCRPLIGVDGCHLR